MALVPFISYAAGPGLSSSKNHFFPLALNLSCKGCKLFWTLGNQSKAIKLA